MNCFMEFQGTRGFVGPVSPQFSGTPSSLQCCNNLNLLQLKSPNNVLIPAPIVFLLKNSNIGLSFYVVVFSLYLNLLQGKVIRSNVPSWWLQSQAYQQDQKYQKDEQRLKGFSKLAEKLRFSNQAQRVPNRGVGIYFGNCHLSLLASRCRKLSK